MQLTQGWHAGIVVSMSSIFYPVWKWEKVAVLGGFLPPSLFLGEKGALASLRPSCESGAFSFS
jgi:hypothetical protein